MTDFIRSFCESNLNYKDMAPEELLAFGMACEALGIENVSDEITEDEFNRLSTVLFAMNDAMEESEVRDETLTEEKYQQKLAERAIAEEAEIEAAAVVEAETIKTIIKGEESQEEKIMTNTTNAQVNEAVKDAEKFTETMKDAAINAGKRVYKCSQKVRNFFDKKANMSDEEFSAYVDGHIDYLSDLVKDAINQRVKDIDEAKFDDEIDEDSDTYDDKLDRQAKETIFTILDENHGQGKWKTFKEIVKHVAKWFFNIIKKVAMLALKLIGILVIGTLRLACVAGSALFKAGDLIINEAVKPAYSDAKDFHSDFKAYRKARNVQKVKDMDLFDDDYDDDEDGYFEEVEI